MQAWICRLFYKYSIYSAGHKKRTLVVEGIDTKNASFSYTEKGTRSDERPTIVFVHGLSSCKEGWMSIVKHIPSEYHCITLDLPAHGETMGMEEEAYSIEIFVPQLKRFFDAMGLTKPMCIIGASMGGSIVALFSIRYPQYVHMICLLAPIAHDEAETPVVKALRDGIYTGFLPDTATQFRAMIDELTVKRPYVPKPLLNGLLHVKRQRIEEHRKILKALFDNDYPKMAYYHDQMRGIDCPTLILWGDQDRVFAAEGAVFFHDMIKTSEYHVMKDCGHDMAVDQPNETAERILHFYDKYATQSQYSRMNIDRVQRNPFHTSTLDDVQVSMPL